MESDKHKKVVLLKEGKGPFPFILNRNWGGGHTLKYQRPYFTILKEYIIRIRNRGEIT